MSKFKSFTIVEHIYLGFFVWIFVFLLNTLFLFKVHPEDSAPFTYLLATISGFIFLIIGEDNYIYRFKNGDNVKRKQYSGQKQHLTISGATVYGTETYDKYKKLYDSESILENDVINATGFTDSPDDTEIIFGTYWYPLITVYKI